MSLILLLHALNLDLANFSACSSCERSFPGFRTGSGRALQKPRSFSPEGKRAFKNTTFAGYELPWNNYSIHTNFFVRISEDNLTKKIESLRAYESQSGKNYMDPDFTRSLAKVRGVQANASYAEAFEIYRWMV